MRRREIRTNPLSLSHQLPAFVHLLLRRHTGKTASMACGPIIRFPTWNVRWTWPVLRGFHQDSRRHNNIFMDGTNHVRMDTYIFFVMKMIRFIYLCKTRPNSTALTPPALTLSTEMLDRLLRLTALSCFLHLCSWTKLLKSRMTYAGIPKPVHNASVKTLGLSLNWRLQQSPGANEEGTLSLVTGSSGSILKVY